MNKREHKLRLPGELSQVRVACDFVVDVAQRAGMSDDDVFQCQLSVEEIFTNIVEHGYQNNSDGDFVELIITVTDADFRISILDDAPLFNPLELEAPDPATPLWERESEGGWGIYFVRQYMDEIQYKVIDGRNCLALRKSLS